MTAFAAKARVYFPDGSHVDIAETPQAVIAAANGVPTGGAAWNGMLGPFTLSSGIVYLSIRNTCRIEALP